MAVSVHGHNINGLRSPEGIDIYNGINIVHHGNVSTVLGTSRKTLRHHVDIVLN